MAVDVPIRIHDTKAGELAKSLSNEQRLNGVNVSGRYSQL